MKTLIKRWTNSYVRMGICFIGLIGIGLALLLIPNDVPTYLLQAIGIWFILEGLTFGIDIQSKIQENLQTTTDMELKAVRNMIKWGIQHFFSSDENRVEERPSLSDLKLTDLKIIFTKSNEVVLKITLFRAGLLIGKGGKQFKELEAFLSEISGYNVTINLIDATFLHFEH